MATLEGINKKSARVHDVLPFGNIELEKHIVQSQKMENDNEDSLASLGDGVDATSIKNLDKMAGIRFLRTIISRNDDSLHCHIVKNDLFDPVIQAFRANENRYNLINSAVLELIEYIRKENFKSLISYVVENYSQDLEKIDYVDSFQQLKLKYEQSPKSYPPQGVTGGRKDHGEHCPNHFSQITPIAEPMKQNDDLVLKKEEDCFTEDSVDEDNLVAARTSASCNQLASANVGNGSVLDSSAVRGQSLGLVDYEHDDDSPTSVSTTSGGPECENSEMLYSSLPANDSVGHEAVDWAQRKANTY